jgi:hypothetical protein
MKRENTRLIILQLKSTQDRNALTNISSIVNYLNEKYGYKIKGHEIQQVGSNIKKMTLSERTNIISSFCAKNEIEYLTYHAPNIMHNIFDERWRQRIIDSILITVKEAEKVFCDVSLRNKVIVVFHLTNFISMELLPTISKELKYKIMRKTQEAFLDFYNNNNKELNLTARPEEITQRCSETLYANENIPFEDLKIISVVIEEFVDRFHHGKEEQSYFPETKDKDSFSEDIRKYLIEHELGRRIARMFLRNLKAWKEDKIDSREPVARFLNSYFVFITDHTGKEDTFFNLIEVKAAYLTKKMKFWRNFLKSADIK